MSRHLIHIGLNTLKTFLPPLTLFVASYFVVNYYDKKLWGEFVTSMLLVNLIALFLQTGSKDYLVRSFSQNPSNISTPFYRILTTRAVFLLPTLFIVVLFYDSFDIVLLTFSWIIGLFIYQSADPLIIYSKKFNIQVICEVIGLAFLITALTFKQSLSVTDLIFLFVISTWIKTLIISLKIFPKIKSITTDFKELFSLTPFFLIGFSGLLHSRIDQYIIALFCDEATIGSYQIFLSAFILLQALSAIIIVPFNKIIYRININVFSEIQRKILPASLISVIFFGCSISACLIYFYQIAIPPFYYVMGILFALPSFIYAPIVYLFFRAGHEKEIMSISYLGAAFNLLFTLLFVIYGDPFGAIISSAISQWIMLSWYLHRKKTIVHKIQHHNG